MRINHNLAMDRERKQSVKEKSPQEQFKHAAAWFDWDKLKRLYAQYGEHLSIDYIIHKMAYPRYESESDDGNEKDVEMSEEQDQENEDQKNEDQENEDQKNEDQENEHEEKNEEDEDQEKKRNREQEEEEEEDPVVSFIRSVAQDETIPISEWFICHNGDLFDLCDVKKIYEYGRAGKKEFTSAAERMSNCDESVIRYLVENVGVHAKHFGWNDIEHNAFHKEMIEKSLN